MERAQAPLAALRESGGGGEEPADTAEIRWHDGAEWQETSLPDSDGAELVADLASFPGFTRGCGIS